MIKNLFFLILSMGLLFSSCQKDEEVKSFIRFSNADDIEITTDTVNVDLNSSHKLLLKVTFLENRPEYFKKINEQDKTELSERIHTGDEFGAYYVQESEVPLEFNEDSFNTGDIFTLIIETNTEQEVPKTDQIVYKIQ